MGNLTALGSIVCAASVLLLTCALASQAHTSPSIYFVDYFDQTGQTPTSSDPLAGHKFIHWQYNGAQPQYTSVKVYKGVQLLATVPKSSQPALNYYDCGDQPAGTVLTVKPVTSDGQVGEGVDVKLSIDGSLPVKSISRIGVVELSDRSVLIDRATGRQFYPRGFNYARLDQSASRHILYEAQTTCGPQLYDPYTAESMFRTIRKHGYNMVRTGLAAYADYPGVSGETGTEGLYTPYLDNIADFIARGAKYGIYTLLVGAPQIPINNYFTNLSGVANKTEYWRGNGPTVLTSAGLNASLEAFKTTLHYLHAKNPHLMKAVLLQYFNEHLIYLGDPPFNGTGKITAPDGKTYDMSDNTTGPASRSACGQNGWSYYFSQLYKMSRNSPGGWVLASESISVGVDYRTGDAVVFTGNINRIQPSAVLMSQRPHVMDFFDMHMYPHAVGEGTVAEFDNLYGYMDMETARKSGHLARMPFIMGEFGTSVALDTTWEKARTRILKYRDTAISGECVADAVGFLMWTLDTFEQTDYWWSMEGGSKFLAELNDVPASVWPSQPALVADPNPKEAVSVPLKLAPVSKIKTAHPGWKWGAYDGVAVK
ncbi:MAG: hypothetical protein ACYC27_00280 [Armatimonadota bacterium]